MDGWMDGWMDVCVKMDGWMDGRLCKNGWMDGWTCGNMQVLVESSIGTMMPAGCMMAGTSFPVMSKCASKPQQVFEKLLTAAC
eukprot:352616-Chlamydomonas_euryale.AAC.2